MTFFKVTNSFLEHVFQLTYKSVLNGCNWPSVFINHFYQNSWKWIYPFFTFFIVSLKIFLLLTYFFRPGPFHCCCCDCSFSNESFKAC